MPNPFEAPRPIDKGNVASRSEREGDGETENPYEMPGKLFLDEEVNIVEELIAQRSGAENDKGKRESDGAQEARIAAWFDCHPKLKNTLRAFIVGSVLMGAAGPLTEKLGGFGVEDAEAGDRHVRRQVGRETSRFLQDYLRNSMEYKNQKAQIDARFRAQMQRAQIQYEARRQHMETQRDARHSNEQRLKMLEVRYAEQRASIMARHQEELVRLESRQNMRQDRTNMRAIGTGIEIILGR